jgi:hypothetical protein
MSPLDILSAHDTLTQGYATTYDKEETIKEEFYNMFQKV